MKQKGLRKIISIILMVTMIFAMNATSFAAGEYTITVSNSVTGKTYKAYKVFDATYSGTNVAYTISTSDAWYNLVNNTDSPFTLTATTTSGVYNVSLKDGQTDATVAAWFNAITSVPGSAAATAAGTGGSVTLEVNSAGYYYITTETGSTVTVTTATSSNAVIDKNQTPGGDLSKTADDTKVQIGDTVTYTITSYVPAYDGTTQIKNYTFEDKLSSGLTAPNGSDVTVQILKPSDSGNITIGEDDAAKTYEVFETLENAVTIDENVITISYDPTGITNYPADAYIKITYTATVNAEAAYKNENSVTQTWTGNSTGKTKTETVYTYGFNLKKYAESVAEGNELTGAEFNLTDGDGKNVYFTVSGSTYTVVPSDTTGATYTISAGSVTIFGLDADDTYTLTETKAPNGYNKLTEAISITVGETGSYSVTTGINTSDTTVVNNAGSTLPSTGGMGTTIFYIVGGVLVLGAAVLFVTRKRLGSGN